MTKRLRERERESNISSRKRFIGSMHFPINMVKITFDIVLLLQRLCAVVGQSECPVGV